MHPAKTFFKTLQGSWMENWLNHCIDDFVLNIPIMPPCVFNHVGIAFAQGQIYCNAYCPLPSNPFVWCKWSTRFQWPMWVVVNVIIEGPRVHKKPLVFYKKEKEIGLTHFPLLHHLHKVSGSNSQIEQRCLQGRESISLYKQVHNSTSIGLRCVLSKSKVLQ